MEQLSRLYERLVPRIRTPGSGALWASDEVVERELQVKTSRDYADVYALVKTAIENVDLVEVAEERCAAMTEKEFVEIVGDGKRPVVFRGYAKGWRCVAEWQSLAKLQKLADVEESQFPHRKYRVFSSDESPKDQGRLHLTDGKAKAKMLSMRKFIDFAMASSTTSSYLLGIHEARGKGASFCPVQMHAAADAGRRPPMASDVPDSVPLVDWYAKQVFGADFDHQQFFLTKGYAYTDLHYDSYDNFYVAVRGTRRWTLAPPAAARWLVEAGSGSLKSGSLVVPHKKMWGTHPVAQLFPFVTVDLKPGDFLFVPACYWHLVESVPDADDFSCAFNYFFSLDAVKTLASVKTLYQALDSKVADYQQLFRSLLTDPKSFAVAATLPAGPAVLTAEQWKIVQRTLAATKELHLLDKFARLFTLTTCSVSAKPVPLGLTTPLITPKQSPSKENERRNQSPARKSRDQLPPAATPAKSTPSAMRTRSQSKRLASGLPL